jgi:hypothetical protein
MAQRTKPAEILAFAQAIRSMLHLRAWIFAPLSPQGAAQTTFTIDLYDRLGIQEDEPAPGMDFEAAWTPSGASCVRHVRIREETSLADADVALPG